MSVVDRDHYLMLIDGKLVASADGEWAESINPANEQPLARIATASALDVDRAVEAAELAQPGWAALSVPERARYLRMLAARLLERSDQIRNLEVMDTGHTISKMRGDLAAAVDLLEYYASVAYEIKGESLPLMKRRLHFTLRQPYGVVARIVPFNHPTYFAVASLAGPLMAGNAAIIKPPEQSPLSSTLLGEICAEVLPAGIVNILPGPGRITGEAIVRHPRIRRIAFTGSVATGLGIQRAAAETCVKHVSLELGGKNPMVICPDVDPTIAAVAAVAGMNFAWQGQSCGSKTRVMVHESIYDAVLERILAKVAAIRIGDPMDDASQMGPVNSGPQLERVCRYIGFALEDGARLATGGARPSGSLFSRGYWIQPTVFADVTADMRVAREEVFGPVMSVMKWRTEDEVVRIANSTEYGLTAAIFSNDVDRALRLGTAINSGYIWINEHGGHFIGMPFGGIKNSGVGREECLDELLSYTQVKSFNIKMLG